MPDIFVCGDVVNYCQADGKICSEDLACIIQGVDFAICNFEAPIVGYGTPQQKSGPHHSQRKETILGLKQQGFDLLLLANNHMLDYGTEGLVATISEAKKHGLDVVGAGVNSMSAYSPLIKKIGGIKFGIINACEAQFGVIDFYQKDEAAGYAWINHPRIDQTVIQLKEKCDFVLFFSHAGLENYSIPQKEWRFRYKHLCDLGVDVLIASHPHVPQGYETYKNKLIFYSLGNFYFDGGRWNGKECRSFAIRLRFEKEKKPTFEPVFHYTSNMKVQLADEDKKTDLHALCKELQLGYDKAHDEMVIDAYQIIRKNQIRSLLSFPVDVTIWGTIKEIVATFLGRRKKINKSLLGLHLYRNEAYYYVVRRALEIEASKNIK